MSKRLVLLWVFILLFSGCQDYVEKERETGYKGKARVNPFLAFERFVEMETGQPLEMRERWQEMDEDAALVILPATMLTSKEYVKQLKSWVASGGHAVFIIDHAEMRANEWSDSMIDVDVPDVVQGLCRDVGMTLDESAQANQFQKLKLGEEEYRVNLSSSYQLAYDGDSELPLATADWGDGAVTFLVDGNLMRNRTIDQEQHIEVVASLLDMSREGRMIFMRGVGISFFGMLWDRGWMVIVGVVVLMLFWLLRHMPRFGPLDHDAEDTQMRAYDHHLEMIGNFHWRLDRGRSLLEPLRMEAQELCHHWQVKTGRIDEGLFEVMAMQTNLSLEQVQRAMTEWKIKDSLTFTNTVADLQLIRKAFR
jgi:hypothetical protein